MVNRSALFFTTEPPMDTRFIWRDTRGTVVSGWLTHGCCVGDYEVSGGYPWFTAGWRFVVTVSLTNWIGMVLGDLLNDVPRPSENESLSVHSFGSNQASEESSGYVSCVMSSGTPSPTNSPQPKVESPSSHVHDVGGNVEIAPQLAFKTEFEEINAAVVTPEPAELLSQRPLFRSHLGSSVSAVNGRVHFIVRPSTSVSIAGKTKIGIDNPLYCNIRRLTPLSGVKGQNDAPEVKSKFRPKLSRLFNKIDYRNLCVYRVTVFFTLPLQLSVHTVKVAVFCT